MTTQIESWINRDKQATNLSEKQQQRFQTNIETLDLMNRLQATYYRKMKAEFPDEANSIVKDALAASINAQLEAFDNKASFIGRMDDRIASKQGYIDRNYGRPYFDHASIGQLEELQNQQRTARTELDAVVAALKAKFALMNNFVGANNTQDLRNSAGLHISKAGYPSYTFNTDAEESARKATLKAKQEAARAAEAARDETIYTAVGIVIAAVVVLLIAQILFNAFTG